MAFGNKACYQCGDNSHIAINCASQTRLCYNCKSADHESNACTEPKTTDSKQCYQCSGIGHIASNCPSVRVAGFQGQQGGANAGPQKCYACGELGHVARACPTAAAVAEDGSIAAPAAATAHFRGGRGGFRGGRGGFPAGGRGGFVGAVGGAPAKVVTCYSCGELNHLARSCTAGGQQQQQGSFVPAPKKCYTCSEFGHIARECPTVVVEAAIEA